MGQMRGAVMYGCNPQMAKVAQKLFNEHGDLTGKGRKPELPYSTEDGALGYVVAVWHDADGKKGAVELRGSTPLGKLKTSGAGKLAVRRWEAFERFAERNGVDLPEGEWLLVEVETA